MDKSQESPFRHNNHLQNRRTPSKVVSDAFSFLSSKAYSDKDGLVRIHSSYSESNLAHMHLPGKFTDGLKTDVYIPEDTEVSDEFMIVTTVEKSPQSKHRAKNDWASDNPVVFVNSSHTNHNNAENITAPRRDSLPNMFLANTALKGEAENHNNQTANNSIANGTREMEEFIIVDYLEDNNKKRPSVVVESVNKNNDQSGCNSINEERDEKEKSSLYVVEEDKEKRKSVTIDGEVVELRSPDRNTKPARAPTWKQNQMIISEAFNFLQDLEGGDTVSVINVPIEDRSDNELHKNIVTYTDSQRNSSTDNKGNNSKSVQQDATLNKDASNLVMNHGKNTVTNGPNKPQANLNSFGKPINSSPSHQGSVPNHPDRFSLSAEKEDQVGELEASRPRQRRKSPRNNSTEDDDDGDSSDEDRGVYRESFRKSTWLYVGDNSEISSKGGSSKESGYISLADLTMKTCDNDSVFGDQDSFLSDSPTNKESSHNRNASISTTVSEKEFRNAYSHVSKRLVKRADSELEYKRFSSKFYDHEKVFTIEKNGSSGYGIHIIGSHPAVITEVDEDSPGALAGVQEGQIVISINNVNVLEHDHDEIIRLVQENSSQLVLEVGCSDVAHIRDLEIPIMSGYLLKQTSAMIFKSWKRRYFILRRDNCLYYYKTEKDVDPLGAIPLMGYTVSRYGDLNKFGFKAEKFDNRSYFFMADTRDDMAKWVGAMNEAALRSKHKKDTWLDVTTDNVGLPALEIRKPDCTGYLYKMGRVTNRWKKHYCVLKDACLYHYKNANSKEAIGVAHLHGYTVDTDGVPGKKMSFCLLPPDPQMRSFSFYAENQTDKIRWTDALQSSIQKWIKVG